MLANGKERNTMKSILSEIGCKVLDKGKGIINDVPCLNEMKGEGEKFYYHLLYLPMYL